MAYITPIMCHRLVICIGVKLDFEILQTCLEYQGCITAPLSKKGIDILKLGGKQPSNDNASTISNLKMLQVNEGSFPTLFAIAMDYLPIQASAVPCERIFSSSAETDTKKRNHISPLLMEALQSPNG